MISVEWVTGNRVRRVAVVLVGFALAGGSCEAGGGIAVKVCAEGGDNEERRGTSEDEREARLAI